MLNQRIENKSKIYNLDDSEIIPLLSPYLKNEFVKDIPLIDKISISPNLTHIQFKMASAFKPEIGKFHVSFLSVNQILQQFIYLYSRIQYPHLSAQVELKSLDLVLKKLIYDEKDIPVSIQILNTFVLDKQRIFQCRLDFVKSSFTGNFDFALPTIDLPQKNVNLEGEQLLLLLKPYFANLYSDGSQGVLKDLVFEENSVHASLELDLRSDESVLKSLQKDTFTLVCEAQLSIIYGLWHLGFQNKPGPVILTRLKRQLHHKHSTPENYLFMEVKKELKKGNKNFLSLHSMSELYEINFNLCIIEGFDENF